MENWKIGNPKSLNWKVGQSLMSRYVSEINMPDSLALYSQLGASPPAETWVMPTDDCNQLFDWDTGYINKNLVPYQPAKTRTSLQ